MPECESLHNASYKLPEFEIAFNAIFPLKTPQEAGKLCKRPNSETCGNYSKPYNLETCSRNELVFDKSIVKTSLIQDLDLLCENSYQKSIYSSLYTVGMLLGSSLVGKCKVYKIQKYIQFLTSILIFRIYKRQIRSENSIAPICFLHWHFWCIESFCN